jgi:single-strand DNA-binding protein
MANLNRVLLIGRLTRDPETRATSGGQTVAKLGLAVNRNYTRRESGERVEETCFVDLEAWGRTAETMARYLRKGRQVFVEGRLRLDAWEREGQKRSRLVVVVEGFQFMDSRDEGQGRPPASGEGSARGHAPVGAAAPVAETPQDDYAPDPMDDDIPF